MHRICFLYYKVTIHLPQKNIILYGGEDKLCQSHFEFVSRMKKILPYDVEEENNIFKLCY